MKNATSAAMDVRTADEYEKLAADRKSFIDRGVDCAKVTVPNLFPPEGHSNSQRLPTPYQSVGASGVNTLANKLLLSLLPPNRPFFRLSVDDATVAELSQVDETKRAAIEEKLNQYERTVQVGIESSLIRPVMIETLKLLLVTGNALLMIMPDGKLRVHNLKSYVVNRDGSGNVLKCIIKETIAFAALPEDVRAALKTHDPDKQYDPADELDVYTEYTREGLKFLTRQVVKNIIVPGSEGSYPLDRAPIIPLRWTWVDNEDYGRSFIEEYLGDLNSAETLSEALVDSASAMAKIIILVAPAGITRAEDVAGADNLAVIPGNRDDISTLQLDKSIDMQVSQSLLNDILQRLARAFMMGSSIQRNAERVTAEEIRALIRDLEDALGGTYALLSQELQLPLVKLFIDHLTKAKRLPPLPGKSKNGPSVDPVITTGVEALGRGQDLTALQQFMTVIQPLGPEAYQLVNIGDLVSRIAVSLGIDVSGLVKSAEDVATEKQAAMEQQQQAMMQQQGGDIAKAVAPTAAKAIAEGNIPVE